MRFGGIPTLPERGICGAQTIIKPTPLTDIFLNYSITVIYIPRLPQKRRASLENPPWQPSNPKSLSLSASVHISIWPPARCAQAPYNLREASIL
ncbi:hypothetical protein ACN38_g8080 [Penicillium nordicum]|uniref:Uncharacterized protein n=1 Tax=Penicillium nordicum TaxID=229535 RepID=A0A0M8P0K3_9EURO|nr:hypothetical protein ACN38_g8080 [Penicillium nordicum]